MRQKETTMDYSGFSDGQLAEALGETLAKLQTARAALALAQEAHSAAADDDDDAYDFSNGAALLATMTAPAAADIATLQKARRAVRSLEAQQSDIQGEQQGRRIRAAYKALWSHIISNEKAIMAVVDIIRNQEAVTAGSMVPALIPWHVAGDLENAISQARQAAGR
jgi:hypothetical protein